MSRKSRIAVSLFCAAVVICSLILQPVGAQTKRHNFVLDGKLTKTYRIDRDGRIETSNVNGSIEVRSWSKEEVEIEVVERRRGDYDLEVEIVERQDRLEITVVHQNRRNTRRSPTADCILRVPENAEIEAKTTNGKVFVTSIRGPVEAGSTNGDVTVEDVHGGVRAETTNGNISVERVTGDVEAETTNQSIYFREITASRIRAETTNGNIRGDCTIDENGRYDFRTTNGSIRIEIPAESRTDVEARCRPRGFSSDFDAFPDLRRDRGRDWSTQRIRGKINGGGALLLMSTTNGDIDLRSR